MRKNHVYTFILFAVAFMVIETGCKKNDVQDPTQEYTTQTDDQLLISAEIDGVANDANAAVESTNSFFNKLTNVPGICDGTLVEDSNALTRSIVISYNGTNCAGNIQRKGTVTLSLSKGVKWSDRGAVLTVHYDNLEITRKKDKKHILLNGTITITNISGGRLSDVGGMNIIHKLESPGMSITFHNGKVRSWQIAVQRVYSYDGGLVITSTGTHAEGGMTNIAEWGVTRAGRTFYSVIEEPMIIRQDCQFRLVSAKLIQHQSETMIVQFGLNEKGEKISCPGNGQYYFKVSWNDRGNKPHSFILPY